jgi:type IV secretory pathway VirB10-like protein
MEPIEPLEPIDTEITEEKPAPEKGKKRLRLYAGLGSGVLVVGLVGLFIAVRTKQQGALLSLSPDDLEQQKYDAQQKENEHNKAAQLRNDMLLMRKEDDTTTQLNNLMSQLQKNDSSSLPVPASDDKQVRAEEEAIAGVIRDPRRVGSTEPLSYEPSHGPRSSRESGLNESRGSDQPMFVYSRSFGGAKYLDAPKQRADAPTAPKPESEGREAAPPHLNFSETAQKSPGKDEKTALIYTEFPPVTLFEGEMIDAVLVNRIIADTEPSPVVCQISKDVFENSGRYVVFPANSRIVGTSQVINYKGAHRLFISFHRIILPNGPALDFPGSRKALKALDETGALGVSSQVNRHWFLQFGTAIFLGVLDGLAGAAQRGSELLSQSSIIMDRTSRNFERILDTIMAQYSSIVPTITVYQGHKMKVYLSDDLLISSYAPIKDRSYYANR